MMMRRRAKDRGCREGSTSIRGWIALGLGIASGYAFLLGLYLATAG